MIVAPSVLSLNYADTKSQLEQLDASKAEFMHFDVMDGHFVPNLTFGPDILKAFGKATHLVKDVHIMVDNPEFTTKLFLDAGADIVTFHHEACKDNAEAIHIADLIHEAGAKAGISIKPGTSVDVLKPLLKEFDLFLIMSVEPGFGGQSFMENSLDKISTLRGWIREAHAHAVIEVDGGINETTGQKCVDAGADVLVAGSYVFKNDIGKSVDTLWNLKPSSL